MAEAVARHLLDDGLLGEGGKAVFVASAGTSATDGQPPAWEAVEALKKLGIEHEGRSKPLSATMVQRADVVFAMTQAHLKAAEAMAAGETSGHIQMLDPDRDVEDPMGQGQEAYDGVAGRFMDLIGRRLKETLGHENRAGSRSSR